MPFQVYILGGLDARWHMSAFGSPAGSAARDQPHLTLHYGRWREDAGNGAPLTADVDVDEWPLPPDLPEPDGIRIERGAGKVDRVSLTDPEHNERRVKVLVTIGRTQIQLHSSDFSEDELVEFAYKLVPAPTDPPGSEL